MRSLVSPLVCLCALSSVAPAQTTGAALWAEYAKNPNAHPVIPNCSFAGYRYGEQPFPEPKVVANVRELGAKGDGKTDDIAAFETAIKKAGESGGAVLVPAGTYNLSRPLKLTANGVVLRGEGPTKSVLAFQKSLSDVFGPMMGGSSNQYSWCGGLVWVAPPDAFTPEGKPSAPAGQIQKWEYWQPGAVQAEVRGAAKRGDFTVTVDPAAAGKLKPGSTVLMTWENPADLSLLHAMAGHAKMKEYDWGKATGLTERPRWDWPVEVVSVKGGAVTLKQPLRVDVKPEWKVRFEVLGPSISEVGIEHLGIKMPPHKLPAHLKYTGFNGIYLNRALHCWVSDVHVENVDNGLIHAAAKNTTITGLVVKGGDCHHATALRVASHDNLIEKFRIDAKAFHGINTEYLSTGNVWSDGVMAHGTFDSHRAMSFELIRTNITLETNDGRPGDGGGAGPFLGARVVHWNITLRDGGKDPGLYVNQPDAISLGALVGVRGPKTASNAWAMVPGDKGCVIADEGKEPDPKDLYQAQLKLRLSNSK